MVRWGLNWLEFGRWILHTYLLQSATIQRLVAAISLVCIAYFFSVCLGLWADLNTNADHFWHRPGGCQIEKCYMAPGYFGTRGCQIELSLFMSPSIGANYHRRSSSCPVKRNPLAATCQVSSPGDTVTVRSPRLPSMRPQRLTVWMFRRRMAVK
jgi:hypothetical protein